MGICSQREDLGMAIIAEIEANRAGGTIPAGFRRLALGDGFIKNNGAFYVRGEGREAVFGFRVEKRQCNPLGICHGGWLATAADMVLPIGSRLAVEELNEHFLLTVQMSIDYLQSAPLGAWVEGRCQLLRRTKRLLFSQCLLTVDDEPVLRASGVFKIGPTAPKLTFEE